MAVGGMPKPNDRVSIEGAFHELYNELTDRSAKSPETSPFFVLKDAFMWAVALGVRSGRRLPLSGKKDPLFIWNQLSQDQDVPALMALAVAETGNVEVVMDGDEVIQIAEEYANAGIRELKRALLDRGGTPLSNLVDLARSAVDVTARDGDASST